MSVSAIKRAHSSTTSDCDSNTSALDQSVFPTPNIDKKQAKKKKKGTTNQDNQRSIEEFTTSSVSGKEAAKMDKRLDEINDKLSNMLTKKDKGFIKDIIMSTIEEVKDQILKSVSHRLEILENEMHERVIEADKYKDKLRRQEEEILKVKEENDQLRVMLKMEESNREKELNELEQYGRRNNVRIGGIPNDEGKQDSGMTTQLIIKTLKDKGIFELSEGDIDISHRLGRWESGKSRPVIVKFVRRQKKIELMKCSKDLRAKDIFVNEDLTWLNQQVLSSLRLKDRKWVEKCWSFEGRLFAVFKNNPDPVEISHKDYGFWLNKPWPKKLKS